MAIFDPTRLEQIAAARGSQASAGSTGGFGRIGCQHLFSTKHNRVEIQTYRAMIACMLILIYTGRRPDQALLRMARFHLDGWASLEEPEAFSASRR